MTGKEKEIAIIGGGPAGLMAAEILSAAGRKVTVYERKPSPGRKFLMAGRGGLNLTHSEPLDIFLTRYGAATERLAPVIDDFPPAALRAWCEGLGQPTFVGSSGRVFPESFKASPLLRAWISRLEQAGVRILTQREWQGWDDDGNLVFKAPEDKTEKVAGGITLLALGGASWPKLGSDGGWVEILRRKNVPIAPLRPANCGFTVAWSPVFRGKFAGQPLKTIALSFGDYNVAGEIMVTQAGIEGGAVYALSSILRDAIQKDGTAELLIDLRPAHTMEAIIGKLAAPRGSKSFSTWLQKALGLPPVAINLLREVQPGVQTATPAAIGRLVKAVPLRLSGTFPLDRAISTAGGIRLDALTVDFMLRDLPGVYAVGEMLDWEAPTGGYLLQATFSTAVAAARGILKEGG